MTQFSTKELNDLKSEVVPAVLVFFTRITEPHYEVYTFMIPLRLLFTRFQFPLPLLPRLTLLLILLPRPLQLGQRQWLR